MQTQEQAGDIFDRIKNFRLRMRSRCSSRADDLRSLALPTTQFTRMWLRRTTWSRCAARLRGGRRGPSPTSLTTRVCGKWCESAESLAKVQHPDPDLLPMPDAPALRGRDGRGARPHTDHSVPAFRNDRCALLLNCGRRASRRLLAWRDGTSSLLRESSRARSLWRGSSTRAG